jgi:putative transcriptional regulator
MKRKKVVYNRLKAVLAEHGKTSLWLAETIKKNKTTISKWCSNKTQPNIETFNQIAEVLKIDVRELLVSNKKTR